tara:strand:+ start:154 stop:285 length:132 start_codon:yes stop_codon:yes gene_type:complete
MPDVERGTLAGENSLNCRFAVYQAKGVPVLRKWLYMPVLIDGF